MRELIQKLFILIFIASCSSVSKKPVKPAPKPGEAPQDILSALPLDPIVKVEGQDLAAGESIDASTGVAKPRAPVIGVWIDSVGLDAFWALGYLQELDKAGVKISKVVGQGFGCWIALAWAQQGSSNQAEWQAFKWSQWNLIGLDASLLKRITGNQVSYQTFQSQFEKWLPAKEFKSLKLRSDCPVVSTRNRQKGILTSGHSLGISRDMWYQMRQPFYGPAMEPKSTDAYLSAWSFGNLRPKDYDAFSRSGKSGEKVDLWIHLRTVPASTWAHDDPWLFAAASKDEWDHETWFQTPDGSWVLRKTLFDNKIATKTNVLDFARRREFLLEGRNLGKKWISGQWFQNNLQNSFSPE